MKKVLVILAIILSMNAVYAEESQQSLHCSEIKMSDLVVFQENNNFGLKDQKDNIIVPAKYQKLVRVGESSWIIQKRAKFGLIDNCGNILIEPKFRHTERIFYKLVKFGNTKDYGLYDEKGEIIIPPQYWSIEPLFGKMFLTYKDYKYGVMGIDGSVILKNSFDDVYMPNPKSLRIKFEGDWYEIEEWQNQDENTLSDDSQKMTINDNYVKVTLLNTGRISAYSALTITDYLIKLFSSISPAYEQTIDELMLSQGAETVSIFMKLSWLPRFPFTYLQKYYMNVVNPYSGPLSDIRYDLKNK